MPLNAIIVGMEFEKEIENIIKNARFNPNKNIKVEIGEVSKNLFDTALQNGFNIAGYKHNVDISGIRHTLKNHGEGKENNKNQIPRIIYEYDKIIFGFKDSKGTDIIKYQKIESNYEIYYLEEIRTGKKTLTLKTMYKKSR